MTLARLCGMDVPPIWLIDVSDIGNLPEGIEQDRRSGTGRLSALIDSENARLSTSRTSHRSFVSIPEDKYEKASQRNIAQVLAAECGQDDIAEFMSGG